MKSIQENISKIAKSNNVESFDVIYRKGSSFNITASERKVKDYKISSSNIVGIRVVQNSKVGISYSEATDFESLEFMTKQALTNATYTTTDPNQKIAVKNDGPVTGSSLQSLVEDSTDVNKKIEMALKLEAGILDLDSTAKSPYNGFSENDEEVFIFNSNGTECYDKEKNFSCYTYALLDRDGKKADHYHVSCSKNFAGLNPSICIDEAYKHAELLLKGEPVASGKYDVIFSTDSLNELLGVFADSFSAKSAIEKTNSWRDSLGKVVAHNSLNIMDVPNFSDALSQSTFDSEGSIMSDLTLIGNGTLENFYHNSSTSSFYDCSNNSRASRSAKGNLGVWGTNLVISETNEDVTSGKYIELISLDGLHSGANPISGDFSFGASGYLYQDGKMIQPIKGITVSGNFYEIIKELQVGSKINSNFEKSFFSPDIRFFNLAIAGK